MPAVRNGKYLEVVRSGSLYPAFRTALTFAVWVGYIAAIAMFVVGVSSGQLLGIVLGGIGGMALAVAVTVVKEGSLMLADIADVTIEAASRDAKISYAVPIDTAPPLAGYGMKDLKTEEPKAP